MYTCMYLIYVRHVGPYECMYAYKYDVHTQRRLLQQTLRIRNKTPHTHSIHLAAAAEIDREIIHTLINTQLHDFEIVRYMMHAYKK